MNWLEKNRFWLLSWLLATMLWGPARSEAADPTSIQEFVQRQDQWGQLVGAGFTLEGRCSALTKTELRMKNCDLEFSLVQPFERPRTMPFIQLSGRLERDGKKVRFRVERISDWKSDLEQLRDLTRQGDRSQPEIWHKAAEWARVRGAFYEDPALIAEAERLDEVGIRTGLSRAKGKKSPALVALAKRAADLKVDKSLQITILHEACLAEIEEESRKQDPVFSILLSRVKTRLPGAAESLPQKYPEIEASYAKDPSKAFEKADDNERQIMARLLYIDVATRLLEEEIAKDGSNGNLIAQKAALFVPERPELAQKYQELELSYHEQRVTKMNYRQILEFKAKLESLKQTDRADRVADQWIQARYASGARTPEHDLQRAQYEWDIRENQQAAIKYASMAMTVDPQVSGGTEFLDRIGYAWYRGKAIKKELVPPPPADPFAAAVREGRIVKGMSDAQVRSALGGAPQRVIRMASRSGITELWHYSSQRLTVELSATRMSPLLKVIRVLEQPVEKATSSPKRSAR